MDEWDALKTADMIRTVVREYMTPELIEDITNKIRERLLAEVRHVTSNEVGRLQRAMSSDLAAYIADHVIVQVEVVGEKVGRP